MSLDETTSTSPPDRNILLLPATVAARLLVGRFIAEAGVAFERLDNESDSDALHDFRVAWRRLRSTVRGYRSRLRKVISKSVRQSLRDIADISGESRDIEVYLQWLASRHSAEGPEKRANLWLTEMFTTRRNAANPAGLRQMLSAFPGARATIEDSLARERRSRAALGSAAFAAVVGEKLNDAMRELNKLLDQVDSIADQDDLHRARIAGKRLRYLLEPLTDVDPDAKHLVEKLKHLQDDIGEMRDAHLFRSEVESLLDPQETEILDPELRDGLAAIALQLRTDESRAYHRMRSKWSRRANKAFFARGRDFARTLATIGALSHRSAEIERKFLLTGLPKRAKGARFIEIDQGWLPGERVAERLRRARSGGRNKYYRTVKLGAGVRRIELEESVPRAIFDFMWPLTAGKRVTKRRYVVRDSGLNWEIDDFKDRELIVAEVELDDAREVPRIPRWLRPYVVREVTDDPAYLNRNLAR